MKLIILAIIFLFQQQSSACRATPGKHQEKVIKKTKKTKQKRKTASLEKFAQGAKKKTLETHLGNFLLDAHELEKAIISVPAKLEHDTDIRPFGDGQTNGKMTFGKHWTEGGFPAIGLQTIQDGKKVRKYDFHKNLKIKNYSEKSLGDAWYKVTPDGWKDSFYFNFHINTLPISKFLEGVPEKYRTFSKNRVAPDPAKMGKGEGSDRFEGKSLGNGYNFPAYRDESVHGNYKNGEKTALGGVNTWGLFGNSEPFKQMYTCFDARDLNAEAEAGVPSGAGWHHIGDAGETLLNNLEEANLPVAIGKGHSFDNSAYGLTDSITAAWLEIDEAFVTLQGEYHWYLNPYEQNICTEIWVHNCNPNLSNSWGFNCPRK